MALADTLASTYGKLGVLQALERFDHLYPQPNGESAVRQFCKQLADPRPYDLGDADLSVYRIKDRSLSDWSHVRQRSIAIGAEVELDMLRLNIKDPKGPAPGPPR